MLHSNGQLSCRRNTMSANRPVREMACRRNVLSVNCYVGELSCRRTVCRRTICRQTVRRRSVYVPPFVYLSSNFLSPITFQRFNNLITKMFSNIYFKPFVYLRRNFLSHITYQKSVKSKKTVTFIS